MSGNSSQLRRPTLLGRLRARRLKRILSEHAILNSNADSDSVAEIQLGQLNNAWTMSLQKSPFAREIKSRFMLPIRFCSWQHFESAVPVMDKSSLRSVIAGTDINTLAKNNLIWRATGGSTGEPFRFPTCSDEHTAAGLDIWRGRKRLGINPEDRCFLLWGHAHLLGNGISGAINNVKRRLYDRLLGYTRASAYELAPADLRRACVSLIAERPAYVIGYSSALDRFARENFELSEDIRALRLKAVIATAEGFPQEDSRERIAATFGAPVLMEYGAVETGPLAYENKAGFFDVLQSRHRLSLRGGDGSSAFELVVTSLDMRVMPLMRYALGDMVDPANIESEDGSITSFSRVLGRCNDSVVLPSGRVVHSEAFTHCIRDVQVIRAFQVVRTSEVLPRLRYIAASALPATDCEIIRRRLAIISPELAGMQFEKADNLLLSVAGKHRMVVDD